MARSTTGVLLAAALAVVVLLAASVQAKIDEEDMWRPNGFIRVQGKSFVDDDCKEFLPNGWNTWNRPLLDWAMKAASNDTGDEAKKLEEMFAFASETGFNVMRMFFTPVDESQAIQTEPGQYVEETLQGFDYILEMGRRYAIKLTLVWVNNWQEHEGPAWWVDPSDTNAANVDDFWTDREARERLYEHMDHILNRKNTINGRVYKDDDTIFSWNLFNEMRCPADQARDEKMLAECHRNVYNWIDETTRFLKMAAPKQMITFGQEGFFAPNSSLVGANPSGVPSNVDKGWAAYVGQDFELQHMPDGIDYMSFHLWPDNWNTYDLEWVEVWLNAHIKAADKLGKPLVLQEFGKRSDKERAAEIRDPYYNTVYKIVEDQNEERSALKGAWLWYWDAFGIATNRATPDMAEKDFPPSSCVVHSDGSDDSTWGIVSDHAEKSYLMQQRRVKDCVRVGGSEPEVEAASISGRRRR